MRAAVELLRRYEWEKAVRAELSPEQLAFHDSPHHLNANHSGRRRGKSEFVPRSAILNALRAPRGVDVVIVGESKLKARLNLNNKLADVIHRHQLPFTFNGQDTCWTSPWGARIIFAGLDSDSEIKKLLGYKMCVVYADECFPAGTLVDGNPIESIQPGDVVWSVDHETGRLERRPVVRVMSKRAAGMVTIRHVRGVVECTPNHPVFVRGVGYVAAEKVVPTDVLCMRGDIREHLQEGQDLLEAMRAESQDGDQPDASSGANGFVSESRRRPGEGAPPARARGEWPRTDGVRDARGVSPAELLGPWSRPLHWADVRGDGWPAEALQAGPGVAGAQDRDRSGRQHPQRLGAEDAGPEEGSGLVWSRVDSVARKECGPSQGPLVYNLEVEGSHTYFAGGLLVHNCDTFASRLVEFWKAISPALSENGGRCFFVGTPSLTRSGGWFEICEGKFSGAWKAVNWATNPFYKVDGKTGAEALELAIQQYCVDNGVARDSDEVKRVWFGQFVNDVASRVYAYDSKRNSGTLAVAPAGYAGGQWQWMQDHGHFTIGVDFGTKKDACSWTVLWSQRGTDIVDVVESQKHIALLPDDASAITKAMGDKYKPVMFVGDSGGLGAPYIEVHNLKYGESSGYFISPATKLGKNGAISLVNGELRSGRLRLHPDAAPLAKEMLELPWHDPMKRDREHDGYENHCCDSMLYAWRDHQVDRYQPPSAPTPAEQAVLDVMTRKRKVAQDRDVHWQSR